ncbi:MAG TPA: adenylate/guanylate cyclase domain-containing protein [Mycobacterium sp.]|nr:adenylate/guanylate cyclase domain-containing protein [Mycobacterium sp.]
MDPSRDGGGGLTATGRFCGSCGTELPPNSKFCNECGAPLTHATRSAEYKQVTVLFADVVHSMDIAAGVGAERLREIMTELVDRCAAVVQRYGGTVDKFTGDGIMAVFGAPVALEDHAVRACMAALGVQEEAKRLAAEVQDRDGIDLQLRVGLNSGQVIAGEIGSGSYGYTAVGEQVGMAQRMESAAPPGGVMLSASTARLVDGAATLGESELVQIKGAEEPVAAHRLLGVGEQHRAVGSAESNLVGRRWEMSAVEGLLDRALDGHGGVVGVVGSPGIGKSRLVREVAALAGRRGVDVFTASCESHTNQVHFHAVARLLCAATGGEGIGAQAARDRVRARLPDADPEDLALFDDLLGIADPNAPLPAIDPDARRRRLTALVNAASLARETPAVYVVEDAHWIDEVSESMLADFFTVIPQTPSLVLVTYRPEYRGPLTQLAGAQTVALAPLSDSESAALITELLGPDPSNGALGQTIAARAAGNPFFAEEIVRDLAERGVLQGQTGAYVSTADVSEAKVPATLQATIAARIDRLDPKAKGTLSAAAVIGSRFGPDLLTVLGVEPVVAELVAAQLIDQVRFTRQPEYVFHHPLIRAVAYESQLKSDRTELHRRLAAAIESRDTAAAEENAALIAEHLQAAGDLHTAYGWHMRAGTWSTNRDIAAAHVSWERAVRLADAMPEDDPNRLTMRLAPRTLICLHGYRIHTTIAGTRFEELQELCRTAGDKVSLALGMAGLAGDYAVRGHIQESAEVAFELTALLESIGEPTLTVGLAISPMAMGLITGDMAELLRLSQMVIDLSAGDPAGGNFLVGAPLAYAYGSRSIARWAHGQEGWRDDFHRALMMSRNTDPMSQSAVVIATYGAAIYSGVVLVDDVALRDIQEALDTAERSADDFALGFALFTMGMALIVRNAAAADRGLQLLRQVREMSVGDRFYRCHVPVINAWIGWGVARCGDREEALPMLRSANDDLFAGGQFGHCTYTTRFLVRGLLADSDESGVQEAEAAIERLAAVPILDGLAIQEVTLLELRALLACANGDEAAYRDYRDRYRAMATSLGFEGHIAWAEAMP